MVATRRAQVCPSQLSALAEPWQTCEQLKLLRRTSRTPWENFNFAVMGDCEPGRFWLFRALFNEKGVFGRQLAAIQKQSVDFSVQLGDMVSRGVPDNYVEFFRQLSEIKLTKPYLSVIGNHDRSSPHRPSNSELYRSLFGASNYFFERGGARFVALDSSAGRVTSTQLRWLDLALDTPLHKIIFTHMPPAVLDMARSLPVPRRWTGFAAGSREFVEIAEKHGVNRVYMGHLHAFGVRDFRGVRYVLTGGGGSPLFPGFSERFYHYLMVTVDPTGVSERVQTLAGPSFVIPRGRILWAQA